MHDPLHHRFGLTSCAFSLALVLASCNRSSGFRDSIADPAAPIPYALHLKAAGLDTARGGGFLLRYRWPYGSLESAGLQLFVGPESSPGIPIKSESVPRFVSPNRLVTFRVEALTSVGRGVSRTLDLDTTTRLVYARHAATGDAHEIRAVDDFGRASRPSAGLQIEDDARIFVGSNGRELCFVAGGSAGPQLFRTKLGDAIVRPVDADVSDDTLRLGWNVGSNGFAHWRATTAPDVGTLAHVFDTTSTTIDDRVIEPSTGEPFTFAPDGSQIAFVTRAEGRHTLMVLDVASSLGRVSKQDLDCDSVVRFRWSHDGDSIAVLSTTDDTNIATLERFDGIRSGRLDRQIITQSVDAHRGPLDFSWSTTEDRLLVVGDFLLDGKSNIRLHENGQFTLWAFDPKSNVRNQIRDVSWSPDGTQFACRSDRRMSGKFQLFVTELDSGRTTAVHASLPASAEVGAYEWSSDSRDLAWLAEATRPGLFELFRADAASATPVRLSGTMAEGARGVVDFAWHPIQASLAFRADARTAGHFELFQVGLDGTRITRSSGSTDWSVGAWSWTRFFER